ncbi:hypothetical protein GCM10008938_31820 [Deinococcus roseus]|uniref:ATPase AAA-type core domain-containing protein n=2 Tax=Deinococcus roseus TaxID=392414 RepID=A0ABQ2D2J6_9DEIO|nr:hypothetical protein GCM10008938_31820 [Deinococcus roseus]
MPDVSEKEFTLVVLEIILNIRRLGALQVQDIKIKKQEEWTTANNLSSGQISLFIGLSILASKIEDDTLVLIDEPETSLHPAWQRKYHELLMQISQHHQNCYFFIATHSPIIISEVDPQKHAIFNLSPENLLPSAHVHSEAPRSIEEVYASYFDILTPNSFLVKTVIIKAVQAYESRDDRKFRELKSELTSMLSEMDQDLRTLAQEVIKKEIKRG